MQPPQNAERRSPWVPGFVVWLLLAFPITAYNGALALHNMFHFEPALPVTVDTALSLIGGFALLLWFSYLGTLFFARISASARKVQPVLLAFWVLAIGAEWLLYAIYVP